MNHSEQALAVEAPPGRLRGRFAGLGWWQHAVLLALLGFLYYSVLGRLIEQWWNDPNFSHGFFVPLFSAFLIWQQRKQLGNIRVQPAWVGLVVILGALLTLVVGTLGAELFLSRCSLILLLAGLVIYFLGWRFFRALLAPWAFLFFMVPIPTIIFNQITLPLQFLASKLAANLLSLLGVPVLRQGNVIMLSVISLEVAEACSGIRSLMSLATLAIIYGYFLEENVGSRVLLALASVPIAVAANALRIVCTGVMVEYWNPEKALGFFHEFSGWLIFIASLLMLFVVHRAGSVLMKLKPKKS